ncbi:MAG: hypothetical protein U5K55_15595 [Aliarcobacter sp.]|nr:hypothetical protein [Aliarcobacter sp.]
MKKLLIALHAQAAMALTNSQLILSLEGFLDAFVSTIASAIDAKSKHTLRTHMNKLIKTSSSYLQKQLHEDKTIYKDVKYTQNDLKEIELAAKMHDIGKISMPESIIDKATKLQLMIDGVELIKERHEIIKKRLQNRIIKKSNFKNKNIKKI